MIKNIKITWNPTIQKTPINSVIVFLMFFFNALLVTGSVSLPNSYFEMLTPSTLECDCIWRQGL